ncbi:MAG: nucleotide exchange factor GrpE [Actinomycetota bacterium]
MPPKVGDDETGFGGIAWADADAEEPVPDGEDAAPDGEAASHEDVPPPPGGADDEVGSDGADAPSISVEDLVIDLERVSAERDQYLDASRRLQAEFENYKKAVAKREVDARERANESLVSEILPVLDACDGALASGAADVEPVRNALMGALTKQGLERLDGQGEAFDPELHDAVMHEPSDDADGPVVAEVMRAGYRWKGRVIRPAMVRVRG